MSESLLCLFRTQWKKPQPFQSCQPLAVSNFLGPVPVWITQRRSLPRDRARLEGRTLRRALFFSFLWAHDFISKSILPTIECDSGGYCPSCLAPLSELCAVTWMLRVARVHPEHLQLISLTSYSRHSWVLTYFFSRLLSYFGPTFSLSYLAWSFNMDEETLLALTLRTLVWHNVPYLFSGSL